MTRSDPSREERVAEGSTLRRIVLYPVSDGKWVTVPIVARVYGQTPIEVRGTRRYTR
jgi:hypothetical protein